jgi:hypothetical protein
MLNRLSELNQSSTAVCEPKPTSSGETAKSALGQGGGLRLLEPSQLPYQDSHRAELLHLQAETEALLHQLQTLQQQRLASDDPTLNVEGRTIQVLT